MDRRRFFQTMGGVAGALFLNARARARPMACVGPEDGERFWSLLRGQFHLPDDYAYLNTGGLGASPLEVTNTVKQRMEQEESAPSAGHSDEDWWAIKEKLAAFLGRGIKKEELAFTSTATEGLNTIVNGLPLNNGDEVITSYHEHPALNIPLLHRMKKDGIKIRAFAPDLVNGAGNLDKIEQLITGRTRLIVLSHVTCTTGQVMPVQAIAEVARDKGIWFALDGAQAVAQVPLDLKAIGVDCFAFSGHKWLLGPKRTGVLFVRESLHETLRPTVVGAYSDKSHDLKKLTLELHPTAQRYEYGTQNDALIYGLETAVDFISDIGVSRIIKRNQAHAERFWHGLNEIPNIEILSPQEAQHRSGMITFRMRDKDNKALCADLTKNRFRVRKVDEAKLDGIRVSFHVYNNKDEVDRLIEEIRKSA